MEIFISTNSLDTFREVHHLGKKVLIATLYSPEPVLLASTRLGPDKLILLIDKHPDKEQEAALKLIQDSLGKVIDVKPVKTDVYDIVKVAAKCVEIIDLENKEDHIFVNITSGRKTKAIGLLFAAYARHERVSKIAYNPEEPGAGVVYLPRLSFHLTESQKKVLECLADKKFDSISDLSKEIELSTAMLYRAIDDLKDMDLITTDEGLKLTDAGKIARL
ncbi:MAG: CRISPR-associated CARF protein Csa3 [Candidatus Woesearchaeota archaeon]